MRTMRTDGFRVREWTSRVAARERDESVGKAMVGKAQSKARPEAQGKKGDEETRRQGSKQVLSTANGERQRNRDMRESEPN